MYVDCRFIDIVTVLWLILRETGHACDTAVPSKISMVPFEPSRTSVVSLTAYMHLENPEKNGRDHDHIFDRIMTWCFSGMMQRYPWLHSPSNRSLFGVPMLRPDAFVVHAWTALITLVDLSYTAFLVPLSIAFDSIQPGTSLSWLTITDIVGTCLYVVDMFMQFHIGFVAAYDIRRLLVMRRGFIAENYIRRGGFVIDALSVVSIAPELAGALINDASGAEYKILFFFRLIRLVRVVRLLAGSSGVSFLTSPISGPVLRVINTATFFLLHVLFTMLVFINLLGCIWWFVAEIEGLEKSWVADAGVSFDLVNASAPAQYTTSVYFAMTVITTVGFGDITPQTVAEMIVSIVFMACAVFYFGYIVQAVAQLTTMISAKSRGTQVVREKLEEVDLWADSRHIPSYIKEQVKRYYMEVWAPHTGVRLDDGTHFKELPAALRAELVLNLAADALKKSYMLSALDLDLLEYLATLGLPRPLVAGHDLYREGEVSDSFWVLQEGEVTVLRGIKEIGTITGPAVIGQSSLFASLLEDCGNRMHTMRASVNCTLWEFPGLTFSQVLRYRPKVLVRLALRYRDHLMHLKRKWGKRAPRRICRMIEELGGIAYKVTNSEPITSVDGRQIFMHEQMSSDDEHADNDDTIGGGYRDSSFRSIKELETQASMIEAARLFAGEPALDLLHNVDDDSIAILINNDDEGDDSSNRE